MIKTEVGDRRSEVSVKCQRVDFDNDLGYCTEEEYLAWKERDSLKLLESQLLGQGIICRDNIAEMVVNIQQEVDQAFDFVKKSPFSEPEEAFTGLYR